jgi:SAM-dependent methyltransferase
MRGFADPDALARRSAAVYNKLASEYYVRERHPTCANFDVLQDSMLADLRPLTERANGILLEVGCGRGRLNRLVSNRDVILSDISEPMLALARRQAENRISYQLIDAFQPPFDDGSIHGIFAFLADPYNHPDFFLEARRILADGGYLSFTLPNYDWATAVRCELKVPFEETHFIHRERQTLNVPSITRSIDQQCELLRTIGFHVVSTHTVTLARSPEIAPSHHVVMAARVLGLDPRNVPLLDVYVASKRP